ncbi:MAG: YggT family protein [Chloroflexota bacterium]
MSHFLLVFIQLFVVALWLLVIGRVLLSWINPRFEGPVGRFLFETTEPLLAPIRRFLPSTGMIDFSPLVLMLLLGVVVRLVLIR